MNASGTGRLALVIEGMSCGHCKANVEKALGALAGVRAAEVDLEEAGARVDYDAATVSAAEIAAAVTAAGYPARERTG